MNVKILFFLIFIFSFNNIFSNDFKDSEKSFKTNFSFDDKPISNYKPNDKTLQKCLIAGVSFVSAGTIMFTTGIVMGLIPYEWLSPEIKKYDKTGYINYPYLTIYTSIGAYVFVSGAIQLLIGIPFLIYSLVTKAIINDEKSKISFTGNGFSIKLDFRFKQFKKN